ncbi:hypothetical protein B0T09DRAFT_272639 [Sordaria sp. MPI-SDFR-AT-0083]|nr:hypothetical protein B0T09DRAFT_272639 [Sordaria sp. MPI-SDFR-AT-0083]
MIWEFTIQPREVDLRVGSRRIQGKLRKHLLSRTRVPAILQVCQESQYLGLYKQAFTNIPLRTPDLQLKYFWVNWELDTLAVNTTDLYYLRHEIIQNSVQRLDIDRTRLYPGFIQHLQAFIKLKKRYLHGPVTSGRFLRVFRKNPLPCCQRNIIIHNTDRWGTFNSIELDEIWDETVRHMDAL